MKKPKRKDLDLSGEWEYRVVKEGQIYTIREVFYDTKGKPALWSDPEAPQGVSAEELKKDIKWMLEAFKSPILKEVNNHLEEI